jgi:hypothetical protein
VRVSVIVVMPAREALRASSLAAFTSPIAKLGIQEPTKKGGLLLDSKFPPLPLAAATPNKVSLATAAADNAPMFVARGTIDAEKIDDVRAKSKGVQIFADPEIGIFAKPHCGPNPIGTHIDVAKLLDVSVLQGKQLDGKRVAVAIMDTGINIAHLKAAGLNPKLDKKVFWAPPGVPHTPGAYAVDHGTMCAFDTLIAAPKCTLLDFPILQSTTPGGSAMAGFLSDALLAYSYLHTQFSSPNWKYKALVVNNSWGMYHPSWDFPAGHPGRYADNPNHPFNIIVGTLARAGADILFAAGNCGADCPDNRCQGVTRHTITGANAHPDVLTLAGCDVTGLRVGYSSQGPAIAGMATQKPDVTAYTHFLGSQAFGAGVPDSGTSTACPVTAGCVAAIRTRLKPSKAPSAQLFNEFIASAAPKPGPAAGWNKDYGAGIIQPVAVATHFGL